MHLLAEFTAFVLLEKGLIALTSPCSGPARPTQSLLARMLLGQRPGGYTEPLLASGPCRKLACRQIDGIDS